MIKERMIELTENIDNDYYDVHFKKGQRVKVLTRHMYSPKSVNKVIACHGHGIFTYANEGQYKEINESK